MFLYLDDIRKVPVNYQGIPHGKWTLVQNYDSFCNTIENYWKDEQSLPLIISFDFDLSHEHYCGDYSKTKSGLDCARFLLEFCKKVDRPLPRWICHSLSERRMELIELLYNASN